MTLVKWMLIGVVVKTIEILVSAICHDEYADIIDKLFNRSGLSNRIKYCMALVIAVFIWPLPLISMVISIIYAITTNKKGS